jgi:hypothetical protein
MANILYHSRLLSALAIFLAVLLSISVTVSRCNGPHAKVFIIGLSKTGTTSLGDAIHRLGCSRSGWEDIRSRYLFHAYKSGTMRPLINHAERFDVLEDIPWSMAYRELADTFPTAKFILSLRKDDERWFDSINAHTRRRLWDGHRVVYGCRLASECKGLYLEKYRRHNNEVVEFFTEREEGDRLLTFVIDDKTMSNKERWGRIVEFLGLQRTVDKLGGVEKMGVFPLSNSKSEYGNRDPLKFHWAVDRCFHLVENKFAWIFT